MADQIVSVAGCVQTAGVTLVRLKFQRDPRGELAPAFLYSLSDPGRAAVWILEWLVSLEDLTFETRSSSDVSMLAGEFGFQMIWMPEGYDIVSDLEAEWEERPYPDNGDHDHCPISHEKLSASGPETMGFWNEDYGWISARAYQEDIVGDQFGFRQRLKSGRVPGRG